MAVSFIKMHGLGNDFVVIDARDQPLEIDSRRAAALANRHTGIGCDQLIIIENSQRANAFMRIYNADGGEVAACGNATRAVALLLGGNPLIETAAGLLQAEVTDSAISVDMGEPAFAWDAIPLAYPLDTAAMPVGWEGLDSPMAVNVGNPHAVFFVDDCAAADLARLGPLIEHDPLFPERVNVNIAQVTGPQSMHLRVWERGAGETLACGTGACASAVAGIRSRRVASPVAVLLPGGELVIEWAEGGPVIMSGPATESFRGSFDPGHYPLSIA